MVKSNKKYGPRFGDLDLIDDIFLTCCALHNQRKLIFEMNDEWNNTLIPILDDDLQQDPIALQRRMNELPYGEAFVFGPAEHIVDFGAGVETKAKKRSMMRLLQQ